MKAKMALFILFFLCQFLLVRSSPVKSCNKRLATHLSAVVSLDVEMLFEDYVRELYDECQLSDVMSYKVFKFACIGYFNLKSGDLLSNESIIVIIDYTQSANNKRLFVVDIVAKKLVYNSLVAHGKNTGNKFAKDFSNEPRSLKSSIGFFITGGTYYGRHGYSLLLDGVDSLYNDNARKRSIVIHGAHYVSEDFINKYGRIGRSWGCPALPQNVSKEIIDTIKGGCCLFIYYNDKEYLNSSRFLNP